jgi:hypothetical protein
MHSLLMRVYFVQEWVSYQKVYLPFSLGALAKFLTAFYKPFVSLFAQAKKKYFQV